MIIKENLEKVLVYNCHRYSVTSRATAMGIGERQGTPLCDAKIFRKFSFWTPYLPAD